VEYVLVTWDEKLQAYRTLSPEERTRVGRLEAALRRINSINDRHGHFNYEIQAVLDSVIDTSDVKF
jgi:hypothetical protein